jgi:mono/diheme cytochrome c family protein
LGACSGNLTGTGADGTGAQPGREGAGGSGTSEPFVAHESLVRRHSRAELDATLRDLLGDKSAPAARFLAEDEFAPYDNGYDQQLASQALIDSLEALAEDVATRMLADAGTRAALVPCTPSGTRDVACFKQTVATLGKRAFRRPLEASDVDAYLPLLELAAAPGGSVKTDFYTAIALFLRSVLQDPEFLYRIEVGTATQSAGVVALDGYEIATRLSYLLWGSTPDDALLARAEADDLTEGSARREEAERLLKDPRARSQLERFHAMWLGYRAIPHPPALTAAFAAETNALIERVVFDEQRDYLDLFRLDETNLDAMLATHYGLPAPKEGRAWVSYGDTGRAGILSHGSVLAAFSKFSDTSPTQRGIFIRTRLLCQSVQSPPANVMVDQPPKSDESPCKAQRYAAHASGSCASCHGAIDPIGFGLERFDIAGRYREHDDGLPECSIDGRGNLPGVGAFSGPKELAEKLIASEQLEDCIVKQYLTFALGRALSERDATALASLTRTFEAERRGFVALMLALVSHDAFAQRKEPL